MSSKRVRALEAENRLLKTTRAQQINSTLDEAEQRLSAFATPAPAAPVAPPLPKTLRQLYEEIPPSRAADRTRFILEHEAELVFGRAVTDGNPWDAPAEVAKA